MSLLGYLLVGIAAIAVLVLALVLFRGWEWTGFSGKTLWSWLDLMIIPLALAAVAFALNFLQSDREQRHEDDRARHAEELAADASRESALSTYMQEMADLMLEGDKAGRAVTVEQVMRTTTLTTLRQLDGRRKGLVVQFLTEAGLTPEFQPRVSLVGADLREIAFTGPIYGTMNFYRADLSKADFRGLDVTARFTLVDLSHANFSGARFTRVRLSKACITGAHFNGADLGRIEFDGVVGRDVDFSDADLSGADFRNAQLADVTLDDATPPKDHRVARSGLTAKEADELCEKLVRHA